MEIGVVLNIAIYHSFSCNFIGYHDPEVSASPERVITPLRRGVIPWLSCLYSAGLFFHIYKTVL